MAKINRRFKMTDFIEGIRHDEKKALMKKGVALREALRDYVPKNTRELMRSIGYPAPYNQHINEGFRITINKDYASYQDEEPLRHRFRYSSDNPKQSSFAGLAPPERRLSAQINKKKARLEKLNAGTVRHQSLSETIQKWQRKSPQQFNYGVGYRLALEERQYIITKADYVKKAIEFTFGEGPDLISMGL
jgi:hypothetical protein